MRIFRHIELIVEVDEVETSHRPINRQDPRGEEQAAREAASPVPNKSPRSTDGDRWI